MESTSTHVSVVDPLGPAIEHTKHILFRPFDLNRWLAITLCAWLASLGKHGGPSGEIKNPHLPLQESAQHAKDFVLGNLAWLIPVTAVVLIFVIAVALVVVWLSSRGRFMFLHCVVYNAAQVVDPWHRYRTQAHSLFLFRIVLGLVSVLLIGALLIPGLLIFAPLLKSSGAPAIGMLLIFIPTLLLLSLVLFLIHLLTNDFVTQLMLKHGISCTDAWKGLLCILSGNKARFALYALFKFVIRSAIISIVLLVSVLTCGCACCLLAIPFLGTALLLPVEVFLRAYSIHYLRQYGLLYDVLARDPAPETRPPSDYQI